MENNKQIQVQELFDKVWPRLTEKSFTKKNEPLTKLIVGQTLEALWDTMNEDNYPNVEQEQEEKTQRS